jgi:cyanophycinase
MHAQGYVCAIGGGSENYNNWSDAPYRWIVQNSDSGKIIIIDVADDDSWLPNYFMSFGADTAYNKTIASVAAANLQSTYDELITAKAIFIRGGDQWDYIRLWKGTKVDTAINFVFNNGGVIAGTSAGAAVLGDVDFSAQSGSAYPDEALINPFYSRMKFEDNFLNLIPDVLFDTHFSERARHGRLIGMLFNRNKTVGRDLIGAGIDDMTAICVTPDGIGEVMGSGAVTIFYKDENTNYSDFTLNKYTIENLKADILTKGWKFDFINKAVSFIPNSAKDTDVNRMWQFPKTNFTLTGSNNISAQLSTNLLSFLSNTNSSNVLVISHPAYNITAITNYLNSNGYTYSFLNIATANLNNSLDADKINNATCFVFAGDSLNVLSYLNQYGQLVPDAFYNAIYAGKPILFFGNCGKIAGEKFIGNTDTDLYAAYRGKMTINSGLTIFGDLIFQPLIFDNSDYYENRMNAVLWGMMRNRKRIGIYLNGNDRINISSSEKSINATVQIPYIIVDARATTKVDSSTYRASGSIGPRQIAAMNNVRFSLTNYPDINFLIEQGSFDNLTEVGLQTDNSIPAEFILYQNYPNPFNPSTKISWQSPVNGWQSLKIYDVLGNEIETLVDEFKEAGFHSAVYIVNAALASGIYFYKLQVGSLVETKKMIYLK